MSLFLTKTPVRLSLGGGGTDVEKFYARNGGFWTSAAISLYLNLVVKTRIDDNYVIKYSTKTERIETIEEIEHEIIRHSLIYMRMARYQNPVYGTCGLEIHITSDVPTRSGLGVSGAMTVALLQVLHQLKGHPCTSMRDLAEEAYHVEHDLVGSSATGKQDQYIAAYGGITSFDVDPDGVVHCYPVRLDRHTTAELESNLILFGTRLERQETADQALSKTAQELEKGKENSSQNHTEQYFSDIMRIGKDQRQALLIGKPDEFGRLLDEHWQVKIKYAGEPEQKVAEAYEEAKKVGSLGGKVIGASTKGAFMMFYCPTDRAPLRNIMSKLGLIEVPWTFDYHGSRIVYVD